MSHSDSSGLAILPGLGGTLVPSAVGAPPSYAGAVPVIVQPMRRCGYCQEAKAGHNSASCPVKRAAEKAKKATFDGMRESLSK
jgi:hypothetical protein